jgi:aspartate/methionine/tyrosine aminotransferase
MAQRTVTIGEAWPGVGLEGLRIGYIAAKDEWWERMRSQKQIQSICTSTPSQFAALRVAEMYRDLHDGQFAALEQRRNQALEIIEGLDVQLFGGATVNLIPLRVGDAERVVSVLGRQGFSVAAGAAFGALDLVRFSVTPDRTVIDALGQLSDMDEEHN